VKLGNLVSGAKGKYTGQWVSDDDAELREP
jgi:hypothetical protein